MTPKSKSHAPNRGHFMKWFITTVTTAKIMRGAPAVLARWKIRAEGLELLRNQTHSFAHNSASSCTPHPECRRRPSASLVTCGHPLRCAQVRGRCFSLSVVCYFNVFVGGHGTLNGLDLFASPGCRRNCPVSATSRLWRFHLGRGDCSLHS